MQYIKVSLSTENVYQFVLEIPKDVSPREYYSKIREEFNKNPSLIDSLTKISKGVLYINDTEELSPSELEDEEDLPVLDYNFKIKY